MRTAEEQSPKPNTMDGFANKNGDETLSRFFDELKPLCSNLLDILQNPQKDGAALMAMGDFLQRAPVEGLQACLDYTMLPLLLLLDAAIRCRSQQSKEKIGMFNRPYMISDRVAEGVLLCLEELLKRCHLRSVDQMVVVLKKLTSGALLSPSEAAEEFRERIIKCFRSLLLGLRSCSVDSCICKNVPGLPFFTMGISLEGQVIAAPKIFCSESEECLLAFLLSENASAAVGHWLSLLLQAAETEAGRGHHGSARLRTEAFLTIRVLIAKVGTADALAFFLPGVVSHFAKVLHVSKTMISGAAGSVESIDHAIKGLTEFLMIVFGDEANRFGLGVLVDDLSRTHSSKGNSAQSFLEALRSLPKSQDHDGTRVAKESSIDETICTVPSKFDVKERNAGVVCQMAPLRVSRTKDWIETTSEHVDKLLSATFPHLCVHPSTKVRLGLVDSIRGLCTNCTCTLRKSKLMLLECFFVLVFDDLEVVAVSAQESLDYLFTLGEEYIKENEIAQIFSRLIEKLPRVMLGGKETIATSHTQGLLAAMYYAGPRRVVDHLLRSHVMAARFMDFLALSLSHNSVFAGSVDNLMLAKPHSVGYLHSIAELKAETCPTSSDYTMITTDPVAVSKISGSQDKHSQDPLKISCSEHELPRMPPWFVHIGGQKLYQALAGILRLLGLSIMADCRSEVSLSVLIDLPLEHIQKLISELRMKQYSKESWKSWYTRSDSGPLLRQASSAVCVLNEIIYGISDQSLVLYTKLFRKSKRNEQKIRVKEVETADQLENLGNKNTVFPESVWKVCPGGEARHHVIDCVRGILHEYLSPEVWDLPRDNISSLSSQDMDVEDLTFHFLRDVAMFHQVIIDGLGIFSLSLGKNFENSGFLHASLYLLLENLISMSYQVGSASDAVLRLLSSSSGHATVGRLVVSNADYIIDSLCRQLRHLDINPNVPNVLAAMLSYIGVAHEILPLLEEPLRSVSLELEVLGRHQHPNLTIPFLKAVREISKASRHESCTMPNEAQAYHAQVKSYAMSIEKAVVSNDVDGSDTCLLESGHWEEMLFKLDESKRYRRSVGSVAGSCLTAVIPLLSSTKEAACVVALDIIEDGVATLEKVEEAYGHEKETKEEILNVVKLCSFHDLQDVMDTADGVDENRLLPAMNKIWPYLVLCLKHKSQLVIRRCLSVVSSVVQICGGDFFIRRFHTDGAVFWKLLATSPFRRKPTSESESLILLPYRNTSKSHDDSMAEVSSRKTQEAVLNTIAEISRNKRSAAALGGVFNKVSGLVVGIACSRSMASLNSACVNALCGLASIDPDFVWLLLADVVYSLGGNVRPPPTSDLAEVSELLPPPLSAKEFLYVKYGGEGVGVDVEVGLAEKVYRKLLSQVFTSQMY